MFDTFRTILGLLFGTFVDAFGTILGVLFGTLFHAFGTMLGLLFGTFFDAFGVLLAPKVILGHLKVFLSAPRVPWASSGLDFSSQKGANIDEKSIPKSMKNSTDSRNDLFDPASNFWGHQ